MELEQKLEYEQELAMVLEQEQWQKDKSLQENR